MRTGILTQAQKAKDETEKARIEEERRITDYESYLNSYSGENTEFTDSLGNKVVVPAGFRVVNPTDNVEDGIVIEDVVHQKTKGSQFVWIPVGTGIKKKDGSTFDITLGRYVYKEDGTIDTALSKIEPTGQLKMSSDSENYYTEGLKDSETPNAHAKNIEDFISKVNNQTHGYYIGRYEARTTKLRSSKNEKLTQITVKSNDYVYNYITQIQAAEISQGMYTDDKFISDLMNSYAWDTAIDFIQKCDDGIENDSKPYSRQNSLNTGGVAEKGTNNQITKDIMCNIYDMASNCLEFSTETCSYVHGRATSRGGYFLGDDRYYTSTRNSVNTANGDVYNSFRPILYL